MRSDRFIPYTERHLQKSLANDEIMPGTCVHISISGAGHEVTNGRMRAALNSYSKAIKNPVR